MRRKHRHAKHGRLDFKETTKPRVPSELSGQSARLVLSSGETPTADQVRYNPDDLVGKKGLAIYETMANDDQVQTVTSLKKHVILSSPLEVVPASEAPEDRLKADFISWNLEMMQGSIETTMFEILSAMQYGFSLTEKNFRIIEDSGRSEWDGKIGWESWRTKSPFGVDFVQDEFGNLRPDGVYQQSGTTAVYLSVNKFILWSYNGSFQNPYGRSDYRSSYRAWRVKEWVIRILNRGLEKHGFPLTIGKIPKQSQPDDRTAFQSWVHNIQSVTSGTMPEDYVVELLESKGGQAIDFLSVINWLDISIARSNLLPDLLGFSGTSRVGSYALGQAQLKIFLGVIKRIRREIEEALLLEQAVRQLIDMNWAGTQQYPRVCFQILDENDLMTRSRVVEMGVKIGIVDPSESWVRPYLNLPTPLMEFTEGRARGHLLGLANAFVDHDIRLLTACCPTCRKNVSLERFVYDRDSRRAFHEECSCGDGRSALVTITNTGSVSVTESRDEDDEPDVLEMAEEPTIENPQRELLPQERFVPFAEIEKSQDRLQQNTTREVSAFFKSLMHKSMDKLIELGVFKKVLAKDAPRLVHRLDNWKVNLGPFKRIMRNAMVVSALDGRWLGMKDLEKRVQPVTKKHAEDEDWSVLDEPLDPEEAMRWFAGREAIIGGNTLLVKIGEDLVRQFDANAFTLAGIESKDILKDVKLALQKGLKTGDPAQAKEDVRAVFEQYIQSGAISAKEGAKLLTPNRLETIVRNNMMEGFNEGRKELYEDPRVRGFVEAYEWSSILDKRTTPLCRGLDGQIFKVEQMAGRWPPAHFSCRSIVSPVVTGETFTFSKINPDNPAPGVERDKRFVERFHCEVHEEASDEQPTAEA